QASMLFRPRLSASEACRLARTRWPSSRWWTFLALAIFVLPSFMGARRTLGLAGLVDGHQYFMVNVATLAAQPVSPSLSHRRADRALEAIHGHVCREARPV